jgi:hypothetical protein
MAQVYASRAEYEDAARTGTVLPLDQVIIMDEQAKIDTAGPGVPSGMRGLFRKLFFIGRGDLTEVQQEAADRLAELENTKVPLLREV